MMASKLYFLMLGWHELSVGPQIYQLLYHPLIADGYGHAVPCNLGDNSGCLEVRFEWTKMKF